MTETTRCANYPECDFEVTPNPRGRPRIYCEQCRTLRPKRAHGAPKECSEPPEKSCEWCSKPLTRRQVRVGNEYCGRQCSSRSNAAKAAAVYAGPKSARRCEQCGESFKPNHGKRDHPQRFCSVACRCMWQADRRPTPPKPLYSKIYWKRCKRCRVEFVTSNGGRRYCSDQCAAYQKRPAPPSRECLRCGSEFVPSSAVNVYCSKQCSSRDGSDRRAVRKRDAYVSDVYRAEIYRRDGYRCQICGKRLAMKKKSPHPKSPSIDHIVPLSLGGTHEPTNVQAAHFGCNSRKSNRGVGDQLLLIG